MKNSSKFISSLAVAVLCAMANQSVVHAKQGATDPVPGTSKGGVKSGGGSTTPTPTPAPVPAIAVGPITFAPSAPVGGVVPNCSGDFRIDPYYPTLLDMTVNISVSSLNVPDGTLLYVNVVGTGGTLYPYTSNAIVIAGGAGLCSEKVFVTLGAGLAGVVITDDTGAVVFTSN